MRSLIIVTLAILLAGPSNAHAGAGPPPDYESGYNSPKRAPFGRSQDTSDRLFEKGKAIFFKEKSQNGPFEYCIVAPDEEEHAKLRKKTLQHYKGSTYAELGKQIRNCLAPEESLEDSFDKYNAIAVLYYLSKRFKLGLKRL